MHTGIRSPFCAVLLKEGKKAGMEIVTCFDRNSKARQVVMKRKGFSLRRQEVCSCIKSFSKSQDRSQTPRSAAPAHLANRHRSPPTHAIPLPLGCSRRTRSDRSEPHFPIRHRAPIKIFKARTKLQIHPRKNFHILRSSFLSLKRNIFSTAANTPKHKPLGKFAIRGVGTFSTARN